MSHEQESIDGALALDDHIQEAIAYKAAKRAELVDLGPDPGAPLSAPIAFDLPRDIPTLDALDL